jgi:hypothetical protein
MSEEQRTANESAEVLTAEQWQQKVSDYDLTLAGALEPEIRSAVEALRTDAVQRAFLAEVTAPVKVVEPEQQFVVPAVPDVMPPDVAERIKIYDTRIADLENSLAHNPPMRFITAYREMLAEAKEKRAQVIFDFKNPPPVPIPPAPPKIQIPSGVTEMVREIVHEIMRAETPSIVSSVVQFFRENPEWVKP